MHERLPVEFGRVYERTIFGLGPREFQPSPLRLVLPSGPNQPIKMFFFREEWPTMAETVVNPAL